MKGAIWYSGDKHSAEQQMLQIKENYNNLGISVLKERKGQNEYSITFTNGDHWRTIPTYTTSRGYKVNISYVSHFVSDEMLNTIIRPCTIALPYHGISFY